MDKILPVAGTAFLIFTVFITFKLVYKIMRSANIISNARKNDAVIIRCLNPVYNIKNYVFNLITEPLLIYCYYRILSVIPSRWLYSYISFIVLMIIYCFSFIIHVIAVFREKYVYLTPHGLILFAGELSFEKFRFVWETPQNPDELSDTLLVYPEKEKIPFPVTFTENLEEAHLLTEINGVNS